VAKKRVAKSGPRAKRAAPAKKSAAAKAARKKKPAAKKKTAKRKTAKTGPKGARKAAAAKKPPAKKKTAGAPRAKAGAPKPTAGAAPRARKPSSKDRKALRDALLALRERLTGQIRALKGESLMRADSVYSPEDGTDAFDRQFALSIVSSENDSVFEIDEALRRIDEGTYGVCEQCGGAIERPRLKALPFVRNCVACQSASEKNFVRFQPAQRIKRR
jgi:RNA polymerase-binding transcription factor DksA